MSAQSTVHMFIRETDAPPTTHLLNDRGTPEITFVDEETGTRVLLDLYAHPDPAEYLNHLAAQLIALAYEYTDAQQAAVAS